MTLAVAIAMIWLSGTEYTEKHYTKCLAYLFFGSSAFFSAIADIAPQVAQTKLGAVAESAEWLPVNNPCFNGKRGTSDVRFTSCC